MIPDSRSKAAPANAWWIAALGLLAVLVYAPVVRHPFIFLDDPRYVTENRVVQGGLTWSGLRWAFTTFAVANWHPLTWLSHMLDVQLFGLVPGWHHLVSVLLHAANTGLVFLLLQRATGATRKSALVAALFAVHPLHVESVAWIAERKDVLSTFFGLLSIHAYVRWVRSPGTRGLALVLSCFALSLLAKPMWVTLPFLLLLLDVWPLGRADLGGGPEGGDTPTARVPFARLVAEKLPLFALSAMSGLVTLSAQRAGGAIRGVELGLAARIENALVAYIRYLGKTFWPDPLVVYYPHPGPALPYWQPLGAGLLLAAITAVAIRERRRLPWLAVGWFWFLGMLVPVIGLVQVGSQAMADRYAYVPIVGIFIATVWSADLAVRRLGAAPAAVAVAAVLAALSALTWRQVGYWSDHVTLFEHALAFEPDSGDVHGMLSEGLRNAGRPEEALAHAREAVRLDPGSARHWSNLAASELDARSLGDARDALRRSLRIDPDRASDWSTLGLVAQELGDLEEAHRALGEAIRLDPGDPQARYRVGLLEQRRGDVPAAIAAYREALRLAPDYGPAWNALAILLETTGRSSEAGSAFREYARARPRDFVAWRNLGVHCARTGELPEAAQAFGNALRLAPNDADVLYRLGLVQLALGRRDEALDLARRLEALDPGRAGDLRSRVGESR